jgi:hypothetical protein
MAAPQEHGIAMEEVHSEDRHGLCGQERPPGSPGPPGCGIDACVLEDLPHRRRRYLVSQAGQLSLDAPVVQAGLSRAISSINASIVGEVLDRPGVRRG